MKISRVLAAAGLLAAGVGFSTAATAQYYGGQGYYGAQPYEADRGGYERGYDRDGYDGYERGRDYDYARAGYDQNRGGYERGGYGADYGYGRDWHAPRSAYRWHCNDYKLRNGIACRY